PQAGNFHHATPRAPLQRLRKQEWHRGCRGVIMAGVRATGFGVGVPDEIAKRRKGAMGFTVYLPGGAKDSEVEAYARLLRQQGKDLGKLPRVREEGTDNRWLHVWGVLAEAEAFARELRKRTGNKEWTVREVKTRPSEGPFGPILIQLTRR